MSPSQASTSWVNTLVPCLMNLILIFRSQTMMYLIISFLRGFASQDHMRGPIRKVRQPYTFPSDSGAAHFHGFGSPKPLVDLHNRICTSLTAPLDRLVYIYKPFIRVCSVFPSLVCHITLVGFALYWGKKMRFI